VYAGGADARRESETSAGIVMLFGIHLGGCTDQKRRLLT
jgi:hypothetical protein